MNQQQDHPYTAEDIRRYLQGEMPEAEMHALEKAALDDPMLADAIEGFQASVAAHGEMKTQQDVDGLHRAFTERYHPTPVKHFPLWQVAAAAVVIILAGVVTFNYYNKPEDQLALNQTDTSASVHPEKEKVYKLPDTAVVPDAEATPSSAKVSSPTRSAQGSSKNKGENVPVTQTTDAEDFISKRQESEPKARVSKHTDTVVVNTSEAAVPQANREITSNVPAAGKGNNAFHVISGRVVNTNMEPLANASLTPSDAYLQTYNSRLNTDRSGNFNMLSPDTSAIVKVTATGYREQLFRLRNNPAQNELVLRPEKPKVSGVAAAKKASGNVSAPVAGNAIPLMGWAAFEEYIEKNKVYPAENSNVAGEVIISFQVNNQGKPSDFKILQSLAKSYDEEAIRLIKDGPKWKVLKGRRATVAVTIGF